MLIPPDVPAWIGGVLGSPPSGEKPPAAPLKGPPASLVPFPLGRKDVGFHKTRGTSSQLWSRVKGSFDTPSPKHSRSSLFIDFNSGFWHLNRILRGVTAPGSPPSISRAQAHSLELGWGLRYLDPETWSEIWGGLGLSSEKGHSCLLVNEKIHIKQVFGSENNQLELGRVITG